MTLDQFANYAEIIGLLLVIASLVYVAQQLRQTTNMMRAESRNAIHHAKQQEIFSVLQNPDVWKGLAGLAGQKMDDDSIRFTMWLTASLRGREHEWFQLKYGALDESSWKSYATAIPLTLASERARAWWEATKPIFDGEFVNLVDELLANETLAAVPKKQVAAAGPTTDS